MLSTRALLRLDSKQTEGRQISAPRTVMTGWRGPLRRASCVLRERKEALRLKPEGRGDQHRSHCSAPAIGQFILSPRQSRRCNKSYFTTSDGFGARMLLGTGRRAPALCRTCGRTHRNMVPRYGWGIRRLAGTFLYMDLLDGILGGPAMNRIGED